MLANYLAGKTLSFKSKEINVEINWTLVENGSQFYLDLIPKDIEGNLTDLLKIFLPDPFNSLIDDLFSSAAGNVSDVFRFEGSTLSIGDLFSLNVEQLRLTMDKSEAANSQLQLAFAGDLALSGLMSVSGCLFVDLEVPVSQTTEVQSRIGQSARPRIQFDVSSTSVPMRLALPLPICEQPLEIEPLLTNIVIDKAKHGFIINAIGQVSLCGGPSWLDAVMPDKCQIVFAHSNGATRLIVPSLLEQSAIPLSFLKFVGEEFENADLLVDIHNLALQKSTDLGGNASISLDLDIGLPEAINRFIGT